MQETDPAHSPTVDRERSCGHFNGVCTFLALLASTLALLVALLSVITGLSRLSIGAHTPLQVFAGWAYGFGVTSLLLVMTT